jgi:cytosine deaminase
MARVKELDQNGINVACGHDCIMDPWYPIGTGSMLDAVHMLVHVGHMTGRDELFRAYRMITTNPLRASGRDWSIAEGRPAHFVVLEATDEVEAIRLRPTARWVVRGGRVIAETEPSRTRVLAPGFEGDVTFTP